MNDSDKRKESRSPTDVYLKVKRWSAIFWIVCTFYFFGGIEDSSIKKLEFLGLRIGDDSLIPVLLFFISIYMLYNLVFCWEVQNSIVKSDIFLKVDYRIHIIVAFLFLFFSLLNTLYSVRLFGIHIPTVLSELFDISNGALSSAMVSIFSASIGGIATMISAASVAVVLRKLRFAKSEQDHVIFEEITNFKWKFYYTGKRSEDESKVMTFTSEGKIEQGANGNEASWIVRNGILEILNGKGDVYSRFKKDGDVFRHTNDDDTLSLRDQFMEKLEKK